MKPSEAPIFAGIAMNARQSTKTRMACAKMALDHYVDQADKLDKLLEDWRKRAESDNPSEYLDMPEMVRSLAEIVEGDE